MLSTVFRLAALLCSAAVCMAPAFAQAPAVFPSTYPADYAKIVAAAQREGSVRVYATTDIAAAAPLIRDFEALYPGIRVDYRDMNTTELHHRVMREKGAAASNGDVAWSSAMDQQIKLINDGYALRYKSPEADKLEDWASWRSEGYGTTYEPIVFVYNKKLLKDTEVPRSHADIARLLREQPARLHGKVLSYDLERSGVGYLLMTQDAEINPGFWDLARALGEARPGYAQNTWTILDRIGSGEAAFGFNLLGSYAQMRAAQHPELGIVMPSDYTLVLSRIMFIAKHAPHPNAAKLWLDYVLSRRGQGVIANQSELGAIRDDVEGKQTARGVARTLGNALKPIHVGPGLLTYLDRAKRAEFLRRWKASGAGE